MQHADAINEIVPRSAKLSQVSLMDGPAVHWSGLHVAPGGKHGSPKVHAVELFGRPRRHMHQETAVSAAKFEHGLSLHILRGDRFQPLFKLRPGICGTSREIIPGIGKRVGCYLVVCCRHGKGGFDRVF